MLRVFTDRRVQDAVATLAKAEQLTVFVGAGASAEVGFPTWGDLVRRLVDRATNGRQMRGREWLRAKLNEGSVLAAAERVQVLLKRKPQSKRGNPLGDAIYSVLYGDEDPACFSPGPLSRAVAALQCVYDANLQIATTNYDQLLVKALSERGRAAASQNTHGWCRGDVNHLHGIVGWERVDDKELVLTESDYLGQEPGWRGSFLREALGSPCLFVGASLTDLNILRGLYAQASRQHHYVTFVRDKAPDRRPQAEPESIEQGRWKRLNVAPIFVDQYADVAQLVHEIAYLRSSGPLYRPFGERLREWFDAQRQYLLSTDEREYRANQLASADRLASLLESTKVNHGLGAETMSLGIWPLWLPAPLVSLEEECTVEWVTSDRASLRPNTRGQPMRLDRESRLAAIRAICDGVPFAGPRDVYASRWHYAFAVPIYEEGPEYARLPLGAIVLRTTARESETGLPTPGKPGAVDLIEALDAIGKKHLLPGAPRP